jgi:hypothetical protein
MKRSVGHQVGLDKWNTINGGIEWSGHNVPTDADSRAMYNAAVTALSLNPGSRFTWKFGEQYVPLDGPTMTQLAMAVMDHVEACFEKERALLQKLAAATTIEEADACNWKTQ